MMNMNPQGVIMMTKINNSDQLIELIRNSSKGMSFDEYSSATGVSKDYIFRILKGEIEQINHDLKNKLLLRS